MPERFQQRRTKGWRKPDGAVSVVRGTEYGNPFKVGTEVDLTMHAPFPTALDKDSRWGTSFTITPELAVALYREWTIGRLGIDTIRHDLADKDLMCWCPIGAPCHADLLIELANPEVAL